VAKDGTVVLIAQVGINSIVTLEKQLLNMVPNLVYRG
jgi:hypothetical protein